MWMPPESSAMFCNCSNTQCHNPFTNNCICNDDTDDAESTGTQVGECSAPNTDTKCDNFDDDCDYTVDTNSDCEDSDLQLTLPGDSSTDSESDIDEMDLPPVSW